VTVLSSLSNISPRGLLLFVFVLFALAGAFLADFGLLDFGFLSLAEVGFAGAGLFSFFFAGPEATVF
jgi:hypothetical protein